MRGMGRGDARTWVGRRASPVALAALAAVAVALGALWLVADWEDPGPADLTLAQLAFGQEDYDGELVRTAGVVRRFGPEDGATRLHFVVEDADANRVELRGGDPAAYEGRAVVVVGRFRFTEAEGRVIDVERIDAR